MEKHKAILKDAQCNDAVRAKCSDSRGRQAEPTGSVWKELERMRRLREARSVTLPASLLNIVARGAS